MSRDYMPEIVGAMVGLAFALMLIHSCQAEDVNINKIIQIESSWNPEAYNEESSAKGLMQITPICLLEFEIYHPDVEINLWNPIDNVNVGSWYLNERIPKILKAFNIPDTVRNRLIAYHDGPGNLRKYLKGERKLGPRMKGYLEKYSND